MALSKVNPNFLNVSQVGGRRNILINGDMRVAQRGTSFSGTTGVIYTLDRWHTPIGSSYNFDTTITQSTTVPTGEGFKYSLKVEADSVQNPTSSHNGGIGQKLEGQDLQHFAWGTSSAKSITISFWVRSNKTGIYCLQLQTNHYGGSDQYQHVKEYTISVANTWEKKTLTFPGLTTQTIDAVTGDGLRVLWWLACGSSDHIAANSWTQSASYGATSNQVNFLDNANNEWYLTGCQLEVGDTATEFEHRPFGEELSLCQRYFYMFESKAFDMHFDYHATNATSEYLQGGISFPVEMRTTPSSSGNGTALTKANCESGGPNQMTVMSRNHASFVSRTASTGRAYLYTNSGYKNSFSAEL